MLTGIVFRRAIEEKVYETCSDLVKECIVVGNLRPSPALFVELRHGQLSAISGDCLKDLILRRIEDFNARVYDHEQIKDKRLIFLVDGGVLPRTVCSFLRQRNFY